MIEFLGGLLYKLPYIQEYHIDFRNWHSSFNMSALKKTLDTKVNSKQEFSLIRRTLGLASKAIGRVQGGEGAEQILVTSSESAGFAFAFHEFEDISDPHWALHVADEVSLLGLLPGNEGDLDLCDTASESGRRDRKYKHSTAQSTAPDSGDGASGCQDGQNGVWGWKMKGEDGVRL
ncbi:unnamed protein product [Sphagnum balticum]